VECIVAGAVNARNSDQSLVAVGDFVRFLKESAQVDQKILGMITEVEERKTKLARKPAGKKVVQEQVLVSNVDQLIILMSAADPFYNKRLIDRYLIVADKGELEPVICINKTDLMDEDFIREDLEAYEKLDILKDRTTVFSGPSGAGKSTVTNALLGNEAQATGGISRQTSKGTHTTTNAQMFALPGGGYIVDTPGIRELAAWQLDADELPFYFHEFDEYMHRCKFAPCTHTHEPGCAVKEAVENGEIDADRYQSYLQILESLD
jgi:ribosome biogenesis GTPase